MRNIIFFIAFHIMNIAYTQNVNYVGNWITFNKDTSFILSLHLKSDSSGYKGKLDIPLNKAFDIEAKKIILRNDTIRIYLSYPFIASFIGSFDEKTKTIKGIWKTNKDTIPLALSRMKRPQTPVGPFNYVIDSVEYNNDDKTVHLGATLTKPKENKKYPVAIMITGSGQEDRDETIFDHKPFAIIADYLTKNGIAVLRVDDRMKGLSKGDVIHATSADYANDVITSINYLKTRKDIDTTKIGLIGHSEGGLIAAIVNNKWPHLKFIISLAGTGVSGAEILFHQQTDALKEAKVSKKIIDAYKKLCYFSLQTIKKHASLPDSNIKKIIVSFYDQWKSSLSDSLSKALNAKNSTGEQYFNFQVLPLMQPWLKYFITTDPSKYWEKVKCPVLILNGSKDSQVKADQNVNAIKEALQKGGNKNITTKIFPGLNHLFQHCRTGSFNEYAIIEESFAPDVLRVMSDWLKRIIN